MEMGKWLSDGHHQYITWCIINYTLEFLIAKQLNRMTSFREQVLNLEQYTSWYMCTVCGWYASSSHFTLTLKVCDWKCV